MTKVVPTVEEPDDISSLHRSLVDYLKGAGFIHTSRVEEAFRKVPRHLFLPDVAIAQVYRDQPIPTKHIDDQVVSSSSQPTIMTIDAGPRRSASPCPPPP